MTRRRFVALVSAVTLVALCIIAVVAVLSVTRTSYGRDQVRAYLQSRIASRVQGRVHIGRITGGLLGGVTIDSLEIRDANDSLFVATGPITVEYDIRDFFDRRILLERLEVERPIVRLEQSEEGVWNYRRIFPSSPRRLPRVQGSLGDYIVADNAVIRGGSLVVTMPWRPADSLSGARRDSAIAANIAREDADIGRRAGGFARTRRWTGIELVSNYVRWADPDSIGRHVDIRSLQARESDPPIVLTDAEGYITILADTLTLDVPKFDITASTGSAKGKVVWGSKLPTRYAVEIEGDSVSLRDVAWVYPTLPTVGSGSMKLEIRSRRANPRVIDYAITDMDVRTTGSRLRGDMTFGVGGRVLEVTDVDLDALPVDFKLIETLSGKPLPVPWAGTIRGTARGPGGPVTRFVVDDAQFVFTDANVAGAISRGSARGELDILYPSLTQFHGFEVRLSQLDLRTPQFLFPNFPRVGGAVAGIATLDSSWLDVRFRDADVTHVDGPAPPTRMTGNGRVTYGDPFLVFDVDLAADSLSFTTLARSYPDLRLRGMYAGPVRVRGTSDALDVTTTLTGAGGRMAFDGRLDIYPPGYAARGRASVTDLNLARLLEDSTLPTTRLSAQFQGDLLGDSLANLVGQLAFDVDRSRIEQFGIRSSRARLAFGNGRVTAQELHVASDRFTLTASGAFGLAPGVRDSLRYRLDVDSLGALRPWILPLDSARLAAGEFPEDSLGGVFQLVGQLSGNVDRIDVSGDLRGSEVVVGRSRAASASGSVRLEDLLGVRRGVVQLRTDTVLLAGLRVDRMGASIEFADADRGRIAMDMVARNFDAAGGAQFRLAGDTTALVIDTLRISPDDGGEWRLRAPARVVVSDGDLVVDELGIGSNRGGRIVVAGGVPRRGRVSLRVDADSVDLSDVGAISQGRLALRGWLDAGLSIAGTRSSPTMEGTAELTAGQFGEVRTERLTARASYDDRRLTADLALLRGGTPAITAHVAVPVDLSLVEVDQRLLDQPLRGTIRADSVDLGLLTAFSSEFAQASGRMRAQIDLGGTARAPHFDGGLTVANGQISLRNAGIRLQSVNADVRVNRDSLFIRTFTAMSGRERSNVASLSGTVRFSERARTPGSLAGWIVGENPSFALSFAARDFLVVARPRIADLYIRSNLQLAGSLAASRLTGYVTVPIGTLYIPETFDKRLVNLQGMDTTLTTDRGLLRDAPSQLLENLDVRGVEINVGDDVWLRSAEAKIQLGGAVSVRSVKVPATDPLATFNRGARPDSVHRLALEGVLTADRGQYTLNLNVVQRTFRVERGTVTFFGDADFNPTLDISALYTVRGAETAATGRDLQIRVRIRGTLANPDVELENPDATIPMSQTDMISYLVTGQPSFELGAEARDNLATAAAILLPSLGSVVGDAFAGSAFDLFQVEAASVNRDPNEWDPLDLLLSTRLGLGKQVTKRTFISGTTNLCDIDNLLSSSSSDEFLRSLGLRLEHNLNYQFSVALSLEPGSSGLACTKSTQRSFLSTPPQIGLDLFKVWRW